jgi:hypothetical protein
LPGLGGMRCFRYRFSMEGVAGIGAAMANELGIKDRYWGDFCDFRNAGGAWGDESWGVGLKIGLLAKMKSAGGPVSGLLCWVQFPRRGSSADAASHAARRLY